nr:MAG TPA: hypothetical protein [Caudoviricetes sp.]
MLSFTFTVISVSPFLVDFLGVATRYQRQRF